MFCFIAFSLSFSHSLSCPFCYIYIYSWWFWTWVFHLITKYGICVFVCVYLWRCRCRRVHESRFTHIHECICLFWKSITHNHTIKHKTPQACDKRIVMHSEKKKLRVFVCTFHYNALAIHRLTLFHSFAHFCSLVFVIGCSSRFELFLLSTLYVHIYMCCQLCSFLSTVLVFVCL